MKVLDEKLDSSPTADDVKELAELRIRNLLSFKELQSLNDTGKFVNEHPLLRNKLEYETLLALWRSDREELLRHYSNCKNSIRRYDARANKKSATDEDKIIALQHKQRHEERALIFKKIITNESDN